MVINPGTQAVGPGSGSANACDDDRAKVKQDKKIKKFIQKVLVPTKGLFQTEKA